jgi:carbamoylphosphate synthase large subunit
MSFCTLRPEYMPMWGWWAGVHSGDATIVHPPVDLTATTKEGCLAIASKIANALKITGPFNIQFIAKVG